MSVYVICQFCGKRIDLIDPKDFESHSTKPWRDHIHAKHPEQIVKPGFVPYGYQRIDTDHD